MSKLWVNLKRDRIWADIYYKGEKILSLKVSDNNRGNSCVIDLDAPKDVEFRIIKEIAENSDEMYNKESFNR